MKEKSLSWGRGLALALVALLVGLTLVMGGTGLTARAENFFKQEVYDKVGMVTEESTFPTFLIGDTNAQQKAAEKMKAAYRAMTEGGFDMGELYTGEKGGGIREWEGMCVQEFRGGAHTADLYGRVHGYIMCGTVADGIGAGCLVNDMLVMWSNNIGRWGYPIGNPFERADDEGYIYQNFIKGYVKLKTADKSTEFVEGKSIDESGAVTDVPLVGVEVGVIRDGDPPYWAKGKDEQIKAAFLAAVDKIENTDVIRAGGYDMGVATDYVTLWRDENLALTQPFGGGDNDGNPYGWGAQGRIMLSDGDAVAFPLLGASLTRWAALNGFRMIGYPLSYPFTLEDGLSYQLFSKAYFVIDELGYIENVQLYAGALSAADRMTLPAETGMAIAMSDFMEVFKNYCNTGEPFGVPDDYMRYDAENKVFSQSFTAPGGTNYIVMRKALGSAVPVTGEAAKLYKSQGYGVMGAPVTNAFDVSGTLCQNFEKGYVRGSEFVPGKNLAADGSEIDIGHVAIHGDTGVFEDGVDWPASATDEFISKVRELNGNGVYCYEPVGKVAVSPINGVAVQEFVNTTSSSKGRIALVKYNKNAPVYALTDVFYDLYEQYGGYGDDGEMYSEIGVPTGERFCFGGKVFQNFRHGYVTMDSANKVSFSEGIAVSSDGRYTDSTTGKEVNPVPDDVGRFGDQSRIPGGLRDKVDEVKAAFQAEYLRLMRAGFYPGETDEELVHQWAPTMSYSWINQTFKNGDSTAAAFGNNSAMKIFVMDLDKGAFSIYSDMLTAWIDNGSINGPGYPVGNQFVYEGDLYQNFANGYIRCPNCQSVGAEFYVNQQFTAESGAGYIGETQGTEQEGKKKGGCKKGDLALTLALLGTVAAAAAVVIRK